MHIYTYICISVSMNGRVHHKNRANSPMTNEATFGQKAWCLPIDSWDPFHKIFMSSSLKYRKKIHVLLLLEKRWSNQVTNCAHVMTAELSWYVQNLWSDWIIRTENTAKKKITRSQLWPHKYFMKRIPAMPHTPQSCFIHHKIVCQLWFWLFTCQLFCLFVSSGFFSICFCTEMSQTVEIHSQRRQEHPHHT